MNPTATTKDLRPGTVSVMRSRVTCTPTQIAMLASEYYGHLVTSDFAWYQVAFPDIAGRSEAERIDARTDFLRALAGFCIPIPGVGESSAVSPSFHSRGSAAP